MASNNQQKEIKKAKIEKGLREASRSQIQTAMSRLQKQWSNNRDWLPERNRYRRDAVQKITDDRKNDQFNHSHLIDYLAASVLVHCYDGWSYLARALEAEMSGDPDAARHLGYYAELRAAFSIMAGEGVGIFNYDHLIVTDEGKCRSLPEMSTHSLIWQALEYWADLPKSTDTLFKVIRPEGIPLKSWLDHFGGSANFISNDWLKTWGLDLSRLRDDRKARNLSSYRPTAFISPGPRPIAETVKTVTELWEICGPGGSRGGFSSLDLHLLRSSVEKLFENTTGQSRKQEQAKHKYRKQINTMLNTQSLSDSKRNRLEEFLAFETDENTPELLLAAGRTNQPTHLNHSQQVLARATLLLRVATGSLSNLLNESGASLYTDLEFWWMGTSVRRRLWSKNNAPDNFADLWQDVSEALDIAQQSTQPPNNPDCHHSFWFAKPESAAPAALLTTTERIFLWGV